MEYVKISADTEITPVFLRYCYEACERQKVRYNRLDKYYNNDNEINKRIFEDISLPNNKLSHSFARYISTISTAYFMGNGIKYNSENTDYIESINDLLYDNYFDSYNYEEAKEMSIKGISYELLYINPHGELKTKHIKADSVVPVFSDDLDGFLSCVMRFYKSSSITGFGMQVKEYVDVYTKNQILTYCKNPNWTLENVKLHMFSDVPVIIRRNNEECKGDFEDVICLINAYDSAQSDTLNDLDYFTDAYLTVCGVDEIIEDEGMDSPIQKGKCLKQRRILYLPDKDCEAKFLTKDINDTATENFKTRVYKDIFFLSLVPNLTDENFSGNLSGVAQKYKLFGLEALTDEKEKYWKSAEKKKLKFLTEYINMKYSKSYNAREIETKFDRSQIANLLETSEIINNLRGILSDETLIGMYPEVENAAEELERRNNETAKTENTGGGDMY